MGQAALVCKCTCVNLVKPWRLSGESQRTGVQPQGQEAISQRNRDPKQLRYSFGQRHGPTGNTPIVEEEVEDFHGWDCVGNGLRLPAPQSPGTHSSLQPSVGPPTHAGVTGMAGRAGEERGQSWLTVLGSRVLTAKEVVTWLKGGSSGSSVSKVYGWKRVNLMLKSTERFLFDLSGVVPDSYSGLGPMDFVQEKFSGHHNNSWASLRILCFQAKQEESY